MKKLILLSLALACASLSSAQTLVLGPTSHQEFQAGPPGVIINYGDGTQDRIGKTLIGGSTISGAGTCITTVATLSSKCGTTIGTVAIVTDGINSADCSIGGYTVAASCVYNGTAYVPSFSTLSYQLPIAVTGFTLFGDSIGAASGLNPSNESFASIISQATNVPITSNLAVTGRTATDENGDATGVTMALTNASIGLYGANDLPFSTRTAGMYTGAIESFIAWTGTLPANRNCQTSNAVCSGTAITPTGSWSNFNPTGIGSFNGQFSATLGDHVDVTTVVGTAVYYSYWCSNGFSNTYSVTVDGTVFGPFTENSCTATSIQFRRFGGLANTTHTVRVTVTAGGGDATVYWIGTNKSSGGFPTTIVGNTIPRPANDTIPHVQTQNANLGAIIATLLSDGLQIIAVNDYQVMASATGNGSSLYQADNTHPNLTGHGYLAGAYLSTLFSQPANIDATAAVAARNSVMSAYSGAYTNATTTMSNVTGLGLDVQASTTYHITCTIVWQQSTSNDGIQYQFTNSGGGGTNILFGLTTYGTATTLQNKVATAFSSALTNSLATITNVTNFIDTLTLNFTSGAAGVIQLQAAATVGGTITIATGSSCTRQ